MIKRFGDGRDKFFDNRFGMFVHWGIYAYNAWHEQELWRRSLSRSEYESIAKEFNPVYYDPEEWVKLAKSIGMTYITFTAKHHDGFCMFNTQHTDYNIMNTPYEKDTLKMLADACKKHDMNLGLYYSLPDWNHPNSPNLGRHHELYFNRQTDEVNIEKYLGFVKLQLEELLTNYGEVYQLFWDVNVAEYDKPELNAFIRKLQPNILINDRGPGEGDTVTPERHVPDGVGFTRPTEGVESLGRESWGYRRNEDYFSLRYLQGAMDKLLAMGGNFMLNVGPDEKGVIPKKQVDKLNALGNWYHRVKESFQGTHGATFLLGYDQKKAHNTDPVVITKKDNNVYVHAYENLISDRIWMKPINFEPDSAVLLNDGREVEWEMEVIPSAYKEMPFLRLINLPVDEYSGEVMVIKLTFPYERWEVTVHRGVI